MKSAAIYVRVSTQRQADEDTIASQIAQLERFAQQNAYEIEQTHRFVDEAVSGKGLNRPALTRLRDLALSGAFTTILCLSPDRLSRNLGIQQLLLEEWRQLNIEPLFINRPRQAENAQDALLLNIEGAFAEYERMVISDRMQRGRLHRLRQGESAPHPAPYGYLYQPAISQRGSEWLVEPAQAEIVKQIFTWYTQDNLTIMQVMHRLNGQKTPSPGGKCWTYSTVQRLLTQSAYRGVAYYARNQRDYSGVGLPRRQGLGRLQYPRNRPRPADEWISVAVPALVATEIWQQAQEKRVMNAKIAARNGHQTYLLRGLLVCGACESLLQARTQNDITYYRCPHGGKHRTPHVAPHTCTIRGDIVESALWTALAQLLDQPQLIQDAWENHRQAQAHPPAQVTRWQQRQQHLNTQRTRLLDAYQAGHLSLDELTQRTNPIVLEIREMDTRIAASQHLATTDISLQQFTAQIAQATLAPDPQTQQEVIRLLIERVVVSDDQLSIEHIVPTTDNSRLIPAQCR